MKKVIKIFGIVLAIFLFSSHLVEARLDDAGRVDNLNKGDSIILKFGVPQTSTHEIPFRANSYPDYINFGKMKITIVEKGTDTRLTLTREEKVKVLEAAVNWAKNACKKRIPWAKIGGHTGGFPKKAYNYAYRKIVLKNQNAPYKYEEIWFPRNIPTMEFGKYVNAPTKPPTGSIVLPGKANCRCSIGLGVGKGFIASGKNRTIRFHYRQIPRYDKRGYGGYRMPTFRHFFYFDPMIIYKNKFYHPLGWKKINKPDWAEKKDMRGGKNWKQRFSFLPDTVIKCEFFSSPGWDCNGWEKPRLIKIDRGKTIIIKIRKKKSY